MWFKNVKSIWHRHWQWHWRLKYTELQSQRMAFTQSPLLSKKYFYQLFELYRQMTLWHFSFFWPFGEILHVGHCSWEVLKPLVPLCTEHLGKSSKKSVFLLSGWFPSLTVSFSWILLVCVWPKIMITCVLKQILHKKKVIFNQILESPILPFCLLLLCPKMVG